MSCCFHHHDCSCRPSCPYPEWIHPLCCNPTHYCCAGYENGPTLVIHKIVLEPCGSQSCTPQDVHPSYHRTELPKRRALHPSRGKLHRIG